MSRGQRRGLNQGHPVESVSLSTQFDPEAPVWAARLWEPKCKEAQMCGSDLKVTRFTKQKHERRNSIYNSETILLSSRVANFLCFP